MKNYKPAMSFGTAVAAGGPNRLRGAADAPGAVPAHPPGRPGSSGRRRPRAGHHLRDCRQALHRDGGADRLAAPAPLPANGSQRRGGRHRPPRRGPAIVRHSAGDHGLGLSISLEALTGPDTPYNKPFTTNGIACTTASAISAILGIRDPDAMGEQDAERVERIHLLLAMYNALQPGVVALAGW